MYCYECGGTYQEKFDQLDIADPYVGNISIKGVPYYICEKCNDILYTEDMARAIEAERNKIMQEILSQFPMSDFIIASETASILGISRQALHKNRRINHGFIYQIIFGGSTIYLRQSVLQFKKTGDGRFPLYLQGYHPSIEYVEDTLPMKTVSLYHLRSIASKFSRSSFITSYTNLLEENFYVN